jgi:hypothetical protein
LIHYLYMFVFWFCYGLRNGWIWYLLFLKTLFIGVLNLNMNWLCFWKMCSQL